MLSLNQLSFDSLFSSSLPSYIRVSPTNPHNTDISTADTIALMDSHAIAAATHPLIRDAVEEIQSSAASDSDEDIIEATYSYVQSKVTFCEDEDLLHELFQIDHGVELLITPPRLLSMHNPKGDCDDFSMLTKSLLYAQGIDTSFTTIAADSNNPKKWSHVYLTHDDTGTAIDTSHGKYVGWEAKQHERKTAWVKPEEKHNKIRRRKENMIMNNGMGNGSEDNYGAGFPVDTSSSGSSFDFSSILAPLTKAGSQIAIAQFGQPQLAPNTFIRTAQGGILTNQNITGGGISNMFGGGGSLGSSGLLIGAVVIIGALALFSKH